MSRRIVYDGPVDPATGLPELPEGYFWRVRRAPEKHLSAFAYIELCTQRIEAYGWKKKKTRTVTVVVDYSTVSYVSLTEDLIWDHTVVRIKDWAGPPKPDARKLLGTYPPKKLGSI